jgi:hypothetical protein
VQIESPGAIVTEKGGATAQVSDHGSKATAQLALLVGGVSFGLLIGTLFLVHILWTEVRLANLHLGDMKAAMLAHGINPNPHLPGESP